MKYQLFSERCSGSNFVEAVLKENFPKLVKSHDYGFKHWLSKRFLEESDFPSDMIFILVNRNPFDWLRSIHRQPWHCEHRLRQMSFSRFIRSEWKCVWDEQAQILNDDPRWMKEMEFERNPLNDFSRFKNVLEVRKVKYDIWGTRLSKHSKTVLIRHEDNRNSPSQTVSILADIMGEKIPDEVIIPKGYKGILSWKKKLALSLSFGLVRGYKTKAKEPISQEDLNFIVCNLNHSKEEDWGYDIESLLEEELVLTKGHNKSVHSTSLPRRE